ncbi:MAG: nitrate- and nitrite sensing domain-containing protein, partial [Rhodocyclaceae bacterium]|nr:nitrate- and nitrite sensing domain-containing protein [Rhodocyclaceae bacterium]
MSNTVSSFRSIRVRLLFLFAALAIGMAFYLVKAILANVAALNEGRQIAAVSEVAVATSALVHELQKERGLSAGFIASSGAKFAAELDKQRKETDTRRDALTRVRNELAAELLPPAMSEGLKRADEQLAQLGQMRQQISALTLSGPQSFAFFSGSIERYLDSVALAAPALDNAAMARQFTAYVQFLNAKEQTGRERATVNAIFTTDKPVDAALLRRFISIVTSQDVYLAGFRVVASDAQKEALTKLLAAPASVQTAQMRQIAFDKAAEGLFGIAPADWFATITAKIDAMKGLEDELAKEISAGAAALQSASRQGLAISVLSTAVVVMLTVLFVWLLSGTLAAVRRATAAAHRIATGDLANVPVVTRQDEIGQLERAIQEIHTNIRAMIEDSKALEEAAIAGRLTTRADASRHLGDYRAIIDGVNSTLEAVIGPLNVAANYVERISKGDIPPKITDSYNGDFNTIKNNLNQAIDAINNMVAEAGRLEKAAVEGRLTTRADINLYQVDYRKIVEGVNNT